MTKSPKRSRRRQTITFLTDTTKSRENLVKATPPHLRRYRCHCHYQCRCLCHCRPTTCLTDDDGACPFSCGGAASSSTLSHAVSVTKKRACYKSRLANVRRRVNLRPLLPYPHPITMLPCSRDLPCEQSRSGTYKHDETHSSGECSRQQGGESDK